MNDVERYLKAATRGLTGQTLRNARAELESHIFERTRQLVASGLSEHEARTRTLQEMGSASTVRRSLLRIHPPTHVWLRGLFAGLALLAAHDLRDLKTSQTVFDLTFRSGYGSSSFVGILPKGTTLRKWAAHLPPSVRVEESGAQARLVHARLGVLSLAGGTYEDRPLQLYTQTLFAARSYRIGAPWYDLRNFVPGLTRVKGPYLALDDLALRAYRAGWPVEVRGRGESARLVLGGVALPPTTKSGGASWAENAKIDLVAEAVKTAKIEASRSTDVLRGGLWCPANPRGRQVTLRAAPNTTYVLLGNFGVLDDRPSMLTSSLVASDRAGRLTLAVPYAVQGGRAWSKSTFSPSLASWWKASDPKVLPLLVVQVPSVFERGAAPDVLKPVPIASAALTVKLVDRPSNLNVFSVAAVSGPCGATP